MDSPRNQTTPRPVPVYFGSIRMKQMQEEDSLPFKMLKALEYAGLAQVVSGKRVAIKVHLGEGTNFATPHPGLVRLVVNRIKEAGGHPFVVHSWGALNGYERGYTAETLGCPVLPTGGSQERYAYTHAVDDPHLQEVRVSGEIEDAEALVVISHVKGHGSTGMGGALKNIGIGMLSGESRSAVHRLIATVPYWNADRCLTAQPCQACLDICPVNAPHWSTNGKKELHIDVHACTYCGRCEPVCPSQALHLDGPAMFGIFQRGMALAAREVLRTFSPDHVLFVNLLLHITPWCDCAPFLQPAFLADVGVLVSRDPVAIDAASLDLLAKQPVQVDMVPDSFKVDGRLIGEGHPFQQVLGSVKNPYQQVDEAARLGIGTREYELKDVEVLGAQEKSTSGQPVHSH